MNMDPNKSLAEQITEAQSATFTPVAYYDQHMDLIRIEFRDCSTFERRINEFLTLSFDNYPDENQSSVAGLTFKGVKHLFKQWDLPMSGVYRLAELLDRIVKDIPLDSREHDSVRSAKELLVNTDMRVSMSTAA